MMIKPYGRNILVEPVEKNQILSADNRPLCEYGKVVAVGDDVEWVEVGDTIGYTVWGVNHLEIDGKRYYFVPEDDQFLLGAIEVSEGLVA